MASKAIFVIFTIYLTYLASLWYTAQQIEDNFKSKTLDFKQVIIDQNM